MGVQDSGFRFWRLELTVEDGDLGFRVSRI